jgi:hypothetical protein
MAEPLQGEIVPAGAPIGRPSSYTEEIGEEVCERLSLGESLRSICADQFMPSQATVYRWLLNEDEKFALFREKYTRARELQADSFFDEITDIARNPIEGAIVTVSPDGVTERREDMLGHRRLMIDALKWQAGKLRPKKYGDKLDVTSDGQPIGSISETERAARIAGLLAEAAARKGKEEEE